MDEETEENLRQRFLAIEKKVQELMMNQATKKEVYKLESEVSEVNSKLICVKFHIKEAKEILESSNVLYLKNKGLISFCTFLTAINIATLLFIIW